MRTRRLLPLLAALALLATPRSAGDGRVVILGFDGAHDQTAAALMDAGDLPNLAGLRAEGTFGGLRSTSPPESPVAWAAINTGQNPAKTNVLGFLLNQALDGDGNLAYPLFGDRIQNDRRPVADFEDAPVFVGWSPAMAAGVGFAGTFLLFFVVFALLLRMGKGVAIALSALLGCVGGFGTHVYHGYLPQEVPVWGNPNAARNFWDIAAEAGRSPVIVDAAMAWDMHAHHDSKVLFGFGMPDARGAIGEWFIYTTNPLEFDRPPKGNSSGLTAGTIFRVEETDGRVETQLFGPINFWEAERLVEEYAALGERLDEPKLGYQESAEIQRRRGEIRDLLDVRDPATGEPKGPRTAVDLVVEKDLAAGIATISIGGESQEVAEGQWSDYFHVRFDLNPLLRVDAITRVKVVHLDEPHLELFVNVLDVDPASPPFWQPVSDPIGFSQDLAAGVGPFETYGWPSATMPFKDGKISTETMLEDLEFTMKWREKVAHEAFDGQDWDLFFSVFSVTDRVQHMMYQYYDEEHPLYDPVQASVEVEFFDQRMPRSQTVPEIYRQMDRIVGDFMAKLEPEDTLLLCADHGFQSGRIQVHVNNWLAENDFLVLKEGVSRKSNKFVVQYVDWEKTRAYSMGMGYIYLNKQGVRPMGDSEPGGIVTPEEERGLMEEIRTRLLADRDPTTGEPFCTDVYLTADEHEGDYLHREADMMVGFAAGYRVSWKTGFGGIELLDFEGEVIPGVKFDRHEFPSVEFTGDQGDEDDVIIPHGFLEPNDSPWSGSHVSVDLEAVKGIFFCNRAVSVPADGYDLRDIAPTALSLLGVEVPPEMDRAPLTVGE